MSDQLLEACLKLFPIGSRVAKYYDKSTWYEVKGVRVNHQKRLCLSKFGTEPAEWVVASGFQTLEATK
jgi:hypothetical protein